MTVKWQLVAMTVRSTLGSSSTLEAHGDEAAGADSRTPAKKLVQGPMKSSSHLLSLEGFVTDCV